MFQTLNLLLFTGTHYSQLWHSPTQRYVFLVRGEGGIPLFMVVLRKYIIVLKDDDNFQAQSGQCGANQRQQEEHLLAQLAPAQPQLRQGGEEGAAAEAAGGVRGELHTDDQCQDSSDRGGQ